MALQFHVILTQNQTFYISAYTNSGAGNTNNKNNTIQTHPLVILIMNNPVAVRPTNRNINRVLVDVNHMHNLVLKSVVRVLHREWQDDIASFI